MQMVCKVVQKVGTHIIEVALAVVVEEETMVAVEEVATLVAEPAPVIIMVEAAAAELVY